MTLVLHIGPPDELARKSAAVGRSDLQIDDQAGQRVRPVALRKEEKEGKGGEEK